MGIGNGIYSRVSYDFLDVDCINRNYIKRLDYRQTRHEGRDKEFIFNERNASLKTDCYRNKG